MKEGKEDRLLGTRFLFIWTKKKNLLYPSSLSHWSGCHSSHVITLDNAQSIANVQVCFLNAQKKAHLDSLSFHSQSLQSRTQLHLKFDLFIIKNDLVSIKWASLDCSGRRKHAMIVLKECLLVRFGSVSSLFSSSSSSSSSTLKIFAAFNKSFDAAASSVLPV